MKPEKALTALIGLGADVCSLAAVAFCVERIPNVLDNIALLDSLPQTFQTMRAAGITLASCAQQLDSRSISVDECTNLVKGIHDLNDRTSALHRALAEASATADLYTDLLSIAAAYCDLVVTACSDRLPRDKHIVLQEIAGDVNALVGHTTRASFSWTERQSLQAALGVQLEMLASYERSFSASYVKRAKSSK